MSKKTSNQPSTLLEAIATSLQDVGRYNAGDVAKPAAILWTDADAQWQSLIPLLQAKIPHMLVFGEYAPAERRGPAIWIKCLIGGVIPECQFPDSVVPIIYMPGVSRQTLRAGEECPDALKPLAELHYRGAVWTQKNGKDWTVEAFLVSEEGVGLDVSKDASTKAAMLGSLVVLADSPLSLLRGKRLEAEDFDRLVIDDQPRDLLTWLGDPEGVRRRWDAGGGAKWSAFCSRCKADYGFDPVKDGETAGGERLGMCKQERDPAWEAVWARFNDAPTIFPGIAELLKRSKPSGLLFVKETWPDENDEAENRLRNELLAFDGLSHADARRKIEALDKEHGARRAWVWSRLGRSPLVHSLSYLALLGQKTATKLGGDSADEMGRLYAEGGFITDEAAMRAIAAVKAATDMRAVQTAVRSLYLPWLEAAAEHFQKLVAKSPLPTKGKQVDVEVAAGHCLLFADGLRFDLGQRLASKAEERGLRVSRRQRWAALPTVTATAKPAASPVASEITGSELPESFAPDVAATKQSLTTDRFRKLLMEAGYEVLAGHDTGTPGRPNARAWAEAGQIDTLGHKLQGKLAAHLDSEVDLLVERIMGLIDAGWRSIRVVTDHGWLLLPGEEGLPKADLPSYLTASKWARCAAIKGASKVAVPTAEWHWNASKSFATAPGIHCFGAGNEYAHGGLSIQECLIPDLLIEPANAGGAGAASVSEVQWLGMRCRVTISPADTALTVDIRTKPNDPASSIAGSVKNLDVDGKAGLIVADDGLAGTSAVLVVLDTSGRVIGKKPTTVGGEE